MQDVGLPVVVQERVVLPLSASVIGPLEASALISTVGAAQAGILNGTEG